MVGPSNPIGLWPSLHARSSETEWLDDMTIERALLVRNLRQLELLNRFLGGHQSLLRGLQRALLWLPKRRLRVVDIGCGGGDGVRAMADWCRKRQLNVEFIGVDLNPTVIETARELTPRHNDVRYVQGDAFGATLEALAPDVTTASLFFHHFPSAIISHHVSTLLRASSAVFISDLHRHAIAHAAFRGLGRVARLDPMTQHDGAVSIRRGFRRPELENLVASLDARYSSISWAFAFRYEVLLVR